MASQDDVQPVFLIGCQRSGSNLLQLLLSLHDKVAAPHPPKYLDEVLPRVVDESRLQDDATFEAFVSLSRNIVRANPVPWESMDGVSTQEVLEACAERSVMGVFDALMNTNAIQGGCTKWICKAMNYSKHADKLVDYYGSRVKFIYLYRDPREVALSFTKAIDGEKHVYAIAKKWAKLQDHVQHVLQTYPKQVIKVSYEELTADPDSTLQRLCTFLGFKFNPTYRQDFAQSEEGRKRAAASEMWRNLAQGEILATNTEKYKKQLTEDQIKIVERVTKEHLLGLGYSLMFPASVDTPFSTEEVGAYEEENAALKESVLAKSDPEDVRRRQALKSLYESIPATLGMQ
ncbi:hypothetical protein PTSG_06197 [Salpingoeca rosetta]|uniref:protein-tyrosine sulfotransferase n=1 Tax=Salpingoeca rosetta (strain ATCC 50818 / BSB-021) TaxID=946362 RepID=F2UC80_SALR5|nr:uncharacterized protein PTSG_06197 [Salpingoeca rosetta]EGD74187.1 hypothetical protein PTSG_06197 [Salpingoeca rosetta]|eukprot:XP_004993087.1 hypothetical protein PTSG_06197 [Salpingoeca rosetta]